MYLRINKLLIIGLILLIGLIGSSCSNSETQTPDEITVGVILPMTGELASYGEPMRKGLEMALEDLDSLNSDNSPTYNLNYVDSKGDPSTAVSAAQKLLNVNNVQYFIGDVSSPVTLALVPIMEENKAFLLSPGASSPKLENISPYFARNYPSSTAESIEAANFMYKERGIEEAAIIHVNSEYGLGLKSTFTETYKSLGGEIVFSEAYEFGRNNFRNMIAKLQSVNPGAIYLGGNQKEMGNFMNQLREAGLETLVVSNISFLREDALNIAGESANGVIVPVAYYDPQDSTKNSAYEFAQEFQKQYNAEPTIPHAVGYDALMLIANAIQEVGNNPKEVAEYIRDLKNYNGALGNISFTDGEVEVPMVFKVVKNGKPVNLQGGQ